MNGPFLKADRPAFEKYATTDVLIGTLYVDKFSMFSNDVEGLRLERA